MNAHFIIEVFLAAFGLYLLISEITKNRIISIVGGVTFIFSTSVFTTIAFYSTFFHFVVVTNVLYLILTNYKRNSYFNQALIIFLLYYQFTYGQIQMTIYSFYFIYVFIFYIMKEKINVRETFFLLSKCYIISFILASHFILPLLDYITTFKARSSNLYTHVKHSRVHFFYLINLFFPEVFTQSKIGWWPVWKNGWSYWESYYSYIGNFFSIFIFYPMWKSKISTRINIVITVLILCCSITPISLLFCYFTGAKAIPLGRVTHFFSILFIISASLKIIYLFTHKKEMIKFSKLMIVVSIFFFLFSLSPIFKVFVRMVLDQGFKYNEQITYFFSYKYNDLYQSISPIILNRSLFYLVSGSSLYLVNKYFAFRNFNKLVFSLLIVFSISDLIKKNGLLGFNDSYPYVKTFATNPLIDFIKSNLKKGEKVFVSVNRFQNSKVFPNHSALFNIPSITGYLSVSPRLVLNFEPFSRRLNERSVESGEYTLNYLYRESVKYLIFDTKEEGVDVNQYRYRKLPKEIKDLDTVFQWRNYIVKEIPRTSPQFYIPRNISFYDNVEDIRNLFRQEKKLTFDYEQESYIKKNDTVKGTINTEKVKFSVSRITGTDYNFEVENFNDYYVLFVLNIPNSKYYNFQTNKKFQDPILVNSRHYGLIIPPGSTKGKVALIYWPLYIGLTISVLTFLFLLSIVLIKMRITSYKTVNSSL